MADEIVLLWDFRDATPQLLERLCAHIKRTTGMGFRSVAIRDLRAEDLAPGAFPVLVRCHTLEASEIAAAMRAAGIRYGYYLDDNFWELDISIPGAAYWGEEVVRRRLAAILDGADPILVATEALKEYLAQYGERVHQVDSFFDFSLVPDLPAPSDRNGLVRAGFASNRTQDLLLAMPDVLAALDARSDFEFEVVGGDPAMLPSHPRIRWFPYQLDYEAYLRFQVERQWDFGLAPLSDAGSHRYKTNNKYREYAALGIPGIYQEASPYAEVSDGVTGLLAPVTRSWRDALEMYLDSPELRSQVRLRARRFAEDRFSLDAVSQIWERHLATAPGTGGRAAALAPTLRRLRRARTATTSGWRGRLQAVRGSAAADGIMPTMRRIARSLWRRIARRG